MNLYNYLFVSILIMVQYLVLEPICPYLTTASLGWSVTPTCLIAMKGRVLRAQYSWEIITLMFFTMNMPAKPLHNSDTVSVHFNHFYCMGICDKLSRHLSMLIYIYLYVDEC